MLSRALILLLLVLNVGVASWWALAPEPPSKIPQATSAIPRLQLLGEVPARMQADTPVLARVAGTLSTTAPQCWRLGPFADAAELSRAQLWLQSRVARSTTASVPGSGHGWRVWLPPFSDRDTARAMAQQIAAAGIKDYYVIPDGAEANSIALGRYGNADAAQRRAAALQAAGFDAKAEALGAQWIEVAALPAFDADAARAATGAAQHESIDCARLH